MFLKRKNTGMFHRNLNLHVFSLIFSFSVPKDEELDLTNPHLTLLYLQEFLLGFNADLCGSKLK